MTISNTTRSVQYSGNGSATAWPFAFVADADSLVVQVYDTVLETLSTIGSGAYSVAFATTGFSAGTVTYPLSGSPLSSTKRIVLSRSLQAVQTLALGNQSTFYPALFEAALDRLVMLAQEISDRAGRSLAVRVGEAAIAELVTSAESRAERALMFDATGLVLEAGPSAGEISVAGVAATSAATSAANALASEEAAAEIQDDLETLLAAGMAAAISFAPSGSISATNVQAAVEQLDRRYKSSPTTLDHVVTVNHGLGAVPFDFSVSLRCKSPHGGYAIGDEVKLPLRGDESDVSLTSIYANATVVGVRSDNILNTRICHKNSQARAYILVANWDLVFRAKL